MLLHLFLSISLYLLSYLLVQRTFYDHYHIFLLHILIFLFNYLFLIIIPSTFIKLLSFVINLIFASHKLATINLIFALLRRLIFMISSNLLNKSSPLLFKIFRLSYTKNILFMSLIFWWKLLQILFNRYFQINPLIHWISYFLNWVGIKNISLRIDFLIFLPPIYLSTLLLHLIDSSYAFYFSNILSYIILTISFSHQFLYNLINLYL